MSVYIKGFPLPNNCGACPLRLAWCRERIYMVTRPEHCPLVPVPPHGRMIDADEFLKRAIGTKCFRGDYALMLEELVGESVTVIPEEEDEP